MGEADVSKLEKPKAGIPNCKPANHSLIVAPLYGRFSVLYRICDVLMEHASATKVRYEATAYSKFLWAEKIMYNIRHTWTRSKIQDGGAELFWKVVLTMVFITTEHWKVPSASRRTLHAIYTIAPSGHPL